MQRDHARHGHTSRTVVRRQYADATNLEARIALHARYGTSPQPWQTWVFDHLELPPDAQVIEIGCGPGDLWRENRTRLPTGWTITLTDLSLGMLVDARQRLGAESGSSVDAGQDGQLPLLQADTTVSSPSSAARSGPSKPAQLRQLAVCDAGALPSVQGRYDAVVANHMLYHVDDVDLVLDEIARVLRTGGMLVAATVGLDHMADLFDVARACSPAAAAIPAPNVAQFSLEHGAERLSARFDDVRVHRFDNPMAVDQVAPLMDYLRSTEPGKQMSRAERRACRDRFQQGIDRDGAYQVRTSTGLLTGTSR